jgi:hypothetical protein
LLSEGIGIGGEVPHEALANGNGHLTVVVRRSDKFGELVAALAKAQIDFDTVLKDQKNPYYNSKYADLASVVSATQPHLAKNGLVIIQHASVDVEKQRVTITSTLAHSSDQWVENELVLPAIMLGKDGRPRFDAQSCGAAMTYGRRYSYQGLAGVAAEQDDDGNAAVGIGSKEAAQAVAQRKIAEHEAKKQATNGPISSLFYSFDDAAQQAYITGDVKLLTDNKELLLYKGKWDKKANAIVTDANGLEDLKYELEQRGVSFKPLKGQEVAEALRQSIAQAAKKKEMPSA